MSKRGWLILVIVLILRPRLLDAAAIVARLMRAILARSVLDLWMQGGTLTGHLTGPIHRWLREQSNGRTRAAIERYLDRLNIPSDPG